MPETATAPDLATISLRANAVRVLVSDLLFPGDPDPLLRMLGQRHGSVLIFSPFLASEAAPAWSGNYEFIDVERQSRHQHYGRRSKPWECCCDGTGATAASVRPWNRGT